MASVEIRNQLNLGSDLETGRAWVTNELGPVLGMTGFRVTATAPNSVTFTRRYLPTWALVVGVLTIPFGLLLLALVRNSDALVVDLRLHPEGVIVADVVGAGPPKVRDLFAKMNRDGVVLDPGREIQNGPTSTAAGAPG